MTTQLPPMPQPLLVQIGNIGVTEDVIMTPAGTWPLADVNVTSSDQTSTTTHTPAWAIVLVIVLIWFFFLSLLFLFAKERRVSGFVSVNVQAGPYTYTEQVPISTDFARHDTMNRVGYTQSLIGQARHRTIANRAAESSRRPEVR